MERAACWCAQGAPCVEVRCSELFDEGRTEHLSQPNFETTMGNYTGGAAAAALVTAGAAGPAGRSASTTAGGSQQSPSVSTRIDGSLVESLGNSREQLGEPADLREYRNDPPPYMDGFLPRDADARVSLFSVLS